MLRAHSVVADNRVESIPIKRTMPMFVIPRHPNPFAVGPVDCVSKCFVELEW
jgi:hypothetical protein